MTMTPSDPDYENRIRESFARQGLMTTLDSKLKRMTPAGGRLTARARVIRSGRTLSVCHAEVHSSSDGEEKIVAMMMATIMNVRDRPGIQG